MKLWSSGNIHVKCKVILLLSSSSVHFRSLLLSQPCFIMFVCRRKTRLFWLLEFCPQKQRDHRCSGSGMGCQPWRESGVSAASFLSARLARRQLTPWQGGVSRCLFCSWAPRLKMHMQHLEYIQGNAVKKSNNLALKRNPMERAEAHSPVNT